MSKLRVSESGDTSEEEDQTLSKTVDNILEKARMVLPGTQMLFGLELIVVFSTQFHERLSPVEKSIRLGTTMLVALATAILVAPAGYHRIAEPESVSRHLVALASRLLSWTLVPLAVAICADFYLVASLVTANATTSIVLALILFFAFGGLWLVLPGQAMNRHGGNGHR